MRQRCSRGDRELFLGHDRYQRSTQKVAFSELNRYSPSRFSSVDVNYRRSTEYTGTPYLFLIVNVKVTHSIFVSSFALHLVNFLAYLFFTIQNLGARKTVVLLLIPGAFASGCAKGDPNYCAVMKQRIPSTPKQPSTI